MKKGYSSRLDFSRFICPPAESLEQREMSSARVTFPKDKGGVLTPLQ
jgi:hypothetical protein